MSYPAQLIVLHRAHCESFAADGAAGLTIPDYLGLFAQWMQSADATGTPFNPDMFGFSECTDDGAYTDDFVFLRNYVYQHVHNIKPTAP